MRLPESGRQSLAVAGLRDTLDVLFDVNLRLGAIRFPASRVAVRNAVARVDVIARGGANIAVGPRNGGHRRVNPLFARLQDAVPVISAYWATDGSKFVVGHDDRA